MNDIKHTSMHVVSSVHKPRAVFSCSRAGISTGVASTCTVEVNVLFISCVDVTVGAPCEVVDVIVLVELCCASTVLVVLPGVVSGRLK